MSKTILVDLSHPFGRGNPLWPSNGDFHIDRVQHMPMHYRLLQTFNDFHMHNSTHADSPSHVIPESPYTHELPLENYYGPAVCLDIPKKHWELITVEDIEKAAAKVEGGIQEGDWVLICTGMNQRWGENDDYFMYSPGMSIEGAHWLVDHKVKGVGFDLQALDHILYTYAAQHGPGPYVPRIVDEYKKEFGHEPIEDYPEWEPVHTILLGNNVMGIENLGGDIEKVKGQRFMFCAFPLRWYMGDGTIVHAEPSPTRTISIRMFPTGCINTAYIDPQPNRKVIGGHDGRQEENCASGCRHHGNRHCTDVCSGWP